MLVAATLFTGNHAAWADGSIGGTYTDDNSNTVWYGWTDSNAQSMYTVAANKTLTLTFTVTEYSGEWAGYVLNITKTANVDIAGGIWFRSPDFAWYKTGFNVGAVVSNTNTKGSMTQSEWQAFVKDATTVMAIQRYGTQVFIKTTVTKNDISYSHYFVQEIGTTNDIYAFLCADAASITISSNEISETDASSIAATTASCESSGFAATEFCSLNPNEVLNVHFTNTSSGTNIYNNWGIELVWDGKYFDLIAGNHNIWGVLWGDYDSTTDKWTQNTKEGSFADVNWPSTDDEVKSKLAGADVTLSIARSGRVVSITALHTPKSGNPFVLKYTLEPRDSYTNFDKEAITVKLLVDNSAITLNYPISKVNAEVSKYGWATFSSDYKLDFTNISGLNAYAVTGYEDTSITKSDALGVVDASQGVLLEGTKGENSTFYNIPVSTGEAYNGTNLLVAGTGESVGYDENCTRYVLGVNTTTSKAEFQQLVNGGAQATVAKGKAYLQFNGNVEARALQFEEEATGIDVVQSAGAKAQDAGIYYNVNGQRVSQPARGLYIVNGKKVVVM